MGIRVGSERIPLRKDIFYYVSHDGYVWGIPMRLRSPGTRTRMSRTKVEYRPGSTYYLDSAGYVCEENQDQ
jgi:hypothetical protein